MRVRQKKSTLFSRKVAALRPDVVRALASWQEDPGPLIASLLLVAMPSAPNSFLFLVVRPGAPSSVLAPSSAGEIIFYPSAYL